jgi:putative addiction module antidote
MTAKKETMSFQIGIGKQVIDERINYAEGPTDIHIDYTKEPDVKKKSGVAKAKIQKIGNSLGIILPRDVLSRQRISEGDYLSLSEGPSGLILSVYDEELQEELDVGDAFMRKYRDTFKALAK